METVNPGDYSVYVTQMSSHNSKPVLETSAHAESSRNTCRSSAKYPASSTITPAEQMPGIHQEDANSTTRQNGVPFDGSMSWMSRALCAVPSSSSLDEIDEGPDAFESRSDRTSLISRSDILDINSDACRDNGGSMESLFQVEIEDTSFTKIEIRPSTDDDELNDSNVAEAFSRRCPIEVAVPSPLHKHADAMIDEFLNGNRFICTGLDTWYSTDEPQLDTECKFDEIDSPRNRSCNPEERKKRIEKLTMNLTPFEFSQSAFLQESVSHKKYSPFDLNYRVRSFSALQHDVRSPTSVVASSNFSPPNDSTPSYELPSCGWVQDTALMDLDDNEDNDFCYDSDPSELLRSKMQETPSREKKSGGYRRKIKRVNSNVSDARTISELMSSEILLVWHRPGYESSNSSPVAVHAWIEHGSYLNAGVIQPKLMWQETCGKSRGGRSVLKTMQFHSVDLLDISRVIPLNHVDRDIFPFAKKSCSFVIQAYDRDMLFEAENPTDRDMFTETMKLLVARLGSKIIVGDRDVLDEFFAPASAGVPGEAPAIV